eukprot:TRINITY_DN9624_c0_g2_i1.p1 TRINITY_DN9624_c0_g2~~TRINITY_DN9624_c0_g2_i1.p1  ORF type:complete len:307 (-),score=30.71 TRINITY_DN9624_c0_g2_i1:62-982(-)
MRRIYVDDVRPFVLKEENSDGGPSNRRNSQLRILHGTPARCDLDANPALLATYILIIPVERHGVVKNSYATCFQVSGLINNGFFLVTARHRFDCRDEWDTIHTDKLQLGYGLQAAKKTCGVELVSVQLPPPPASGEADPQYPEDPKRADPYPNDICLLFAKGIPVLEDALPVLATPTSCVGLEARFCGFPCPPTKQEMDELIRRYAGPDDEYERFAMISQYYAALPPFIKQTHTAHVQAASDRIIVALTNAAPGMSGGLLEYGNMMVGMHTRSNGGAWFISVHHPAFQAVLAYVEEQRAKFAAVTQ